MYWCSQMQLVVSVCVWRGEGGGGGGGALECGCWMGAKAYDLLLTIYISQITKPTGYRLLPAKNSAKNVVASCNFTIIN